MSGLAETLKLEVKLVDRRFEERRCTEDRADDVRAVAPFLLRRKSVGTFAFQLLRQLGEMMGREYVLPIQTLSGGAFSCLGNPLRSRSPRRT